MNKEISKYLFFTATFLIDTKPQYHYIDCADMLIGNHSDYLKWQNKQIHCVLCKHMSVL